MYLLIAAVTFAVTALADRTRFREDLRAFRTKVKVLKESLQRK